MFVVLACTTLLVMESFARPVVSKAKFSIVADALGVILPNSFALAIKVLIPAIAAEKLVSPNLVRLSKTTDEASARPSDVDSIFTCASAVLA